MQPISGYLEHSDRAHLYFIPFGHHLSTLRLIALNGFNSFLHVNVLNCNTL